MDYFISDTHFGHDNILGYDGRPYRDTGEMDAALAENWNRSVGKDDDVWILGDVVWTRDPKTAEEAICRLNGRKHLVVGNHDQVFTKNSRHFLESGLLAEMVHYKELQIPHVPGKVILSHYPIAAFNGQFHGWYHFYGHVHNSPQWNMVDFMRRQSEEIYQAPCQMINVGCMMPWMGYTPRSFESLCVAMEDEGFRKPGQRKAEEAEAQERSSDARNPSHRETARRVGHARRDTVNSVYENGLGEKDGISAHQ